MLLSKLKCQYTTTSSANQNSMKEHTEVEKVLPEEFNKYRSGQVELHSKQLARLTVSTEAKCVGDAYDVLGSNTRSYNKMSL